ncbi:MAG: 50S ribosomal protein L6 [Candidatus Beckwithbacteria bacterium GW2011_GWC2_47_9]|uniref:50S ribosomal protein L6 n=2 Tax=Candidatus Beckwithiibacteriota TaxID=1752726 RepID=A0A0G1WBP6_9BACT|nr:MAG: 50S ribosomal protein L6 [Candidatus Beckwithbacteria bacterium GW2011_GWC2_47_9]
MQSRVTKPIILPQGFSVATKGKIITVKNDKGELSFTLPKSHNQVADAGTRRSLTVNAVTGLTTGFSKTLEIQGTGYRAAVKDKGLELALGFSHPVNFTPPEGITLVLKDNRFITVTGADKYLVGQTAANLRRLRQPDAYKGKGIRYQGEVIKLKPGKAAKAAEA